jgi:hypothetical protein
MLEGRQVNGIEVSKSCSFCSCYLTYECFFEGSHVWNLHCDLIGQVKIKHVGACTVSHLDVRLREATSISIPETLWTPPLSVFSSVIREVLFIHLKTLRKRENSYRHGLFRSHPYAGYRSQLHFLYGYTEIP